MTFGRSDADFWRLSPAKLTALCDAHIEAHADPSTSSTRKASSNPRSDLAALGADL